MVNVMGDGRDICYIAVIIPVFAQCISQLGS